MPQRDTPAQMPNFARSDNVNLAYAQANTVVNLAQPSTSLMVTKVSGGHNCWLADNSACGQILTTWITNWAGATGAASATQVQLVAPPVQTVGQSLNFPAYAGATTEQTVYTLTSVYCSRCHSPNASPATSSRRISRRRWRRSRMPTRRPFRRSTSPAACRSMPPPAARTRASTSACCTDNHNCWSNCATDAAQMLQEIQAFAKMLTPTNIDPDAGHQQGAHPGAGYGGERRQPLRCRHHREVRIPNRHRVSWPTTPAASIRPRT